MSSPPPERPKKTSRPKAKAAADESSQEKKTDESAESKPASPPEPKAPPLPPLSESPHLAGDPRGKAWVERLEDDRQRVTIRHHVMLGVLIAVSLLLLMVLLKIYGTTAGRYAVVDTVRVEQNARKQGSFTLTLNIRKPGAVRIRSRSAVIESEHIERFAVAGEATRRFDVPYTPGDPIDITVESGRGFFFRSKFSQRYETTNRIDIVVILDRSGAITMSDVELSELLMSLCGKMYKAGIKYRVSLVGFGASAGGPQIFEFTDDVDLLKDGLARLVSTEASSVRAPALHALELVARLSYGADAMRRVYLVTDAAAGSGGASPEVIAGVASLLEKNRIELRVFSLTQNAAGYAELLGREGRFATIDKFDDAMNDPHVLQ